MFGKFVFAPVAAVAAFLLTGPAIAATYTVGGTLAYDESVSVGDAGILSSVRSRLDTKNFHLTFDLDFATADSDPAADVGLFQNAVSGSSAVIGSGPGAFSFTPATNPCPRPDTFDCLVKAENDAFADSAGVGFDRYLLASEIMDSSAFTGAIDPGDISFFFASIEFFLSAGGFDLFDSPAIIDPASLPLTLGSLAVRFRDRDSFGFAEFDIDVSEVYEGELRVSPVPLPAAFWLFGAALVGLLKFGRPGKAE